MIRIRFYCASTYTKRPEPRTDRRDSRPRVVGLTLRETTNKVSLVARPCTNSQLCLGNYQYVRGKRTRKSSRWFLPFFVSYRSIAVSCELSLRPEMRMYKNDVHRYCVGFVALRLSRDVLDSQSRRLQWSALSGRNVR